MTSKCESVPVRDLNLNVRHWGPADAPALFMLHGWMDASATFQFVVEAFARDWHVIAPDLRGYGASDWLHRPYWFPDYLTDLDVLLARYSPERPARLIGHSMGGNIVASYAAARPQRVAQLALLDFLGLPAPAPADAPLRLRQWLDEQREPPRLRRYPDRDALARRLMSANARLTPERARFLARHVGRQDDDGQVQMACDSWHKLPSPTPYRVDEAIACWQTIAAPVALLIADHGIVQRRFAQVPEERGRRLAAFRNARSFVIEDSGHNLQHDQPEQVAAALERFLAYEEAPPV